MNDSPRNADWELQARNNRERMPQLAVFVDHLRSLFGQVTVRWASEGGFEVGERGPEGVPVSPPPYISEKGKGEKR